ncbi:ammonium transporter [Acinetobacter marinus]|uniref:ammonium transporter n=1 Tax=Acinetobacter marinus TaxID=281375 RepID=UPI003615CE9D
MKYIAWLLLFLPGFVHAENSTEISNADLKLMLDSIWVVLCGVLVFFMQAGFALIESGTVRSKNTVNVLMKNYIDACVGGLVFWLIGFGLMFGVNPTGWIGLSHFAPNNMDGWHWTMLFFQMMFAATATTIASGAMAERIHFSGYIICTVFVSALIYPIFGSWAWGSMFEGAGWLKSMGFIDFAGSTVVHSIGGWVALAGVMILGPRLGRFARDGKPHHIPGHNLSLVALGGFILWLSWFGFNAGSTVAADVSIGKIALNTHLAACASAVAYLLLAMLRGKAILLTMTINASLGGLVAITAGCATMSPLFSILTGLVAGVVVTFLPAILEKFKIDDAVDAFTVHTGCGIWGTLAAGFFLENDLFNLSQLGVQAIGVCAAAVWGFGCAFVMFWVVDKVMGGLRVSKQHEQRGLDYTEHAELSYPEFQHDVLADLDEITKRH